MNYDVYDSNVVRILPNTQSQVPRGVPRSSNVDTKLPKLLCSACDVHNS